MKILIWIFLLSILTIPPSLAGQYIASDGIPVENQFIVVLKDDVPSVHAREGLLQNLASQHGARHTQTYIKALNGGVMQMTEAKAKALAHHPFISYIEQDSVIQLIVPMSIFTQSPTPSWGLDRIDQSLLPLNNAYNYSNDGTGVNAYVIDTGIYTSHTDFNGRASIGADFVNDGNTNDCHGHGTHVAGTIGGTTYGVAKNAKLIAVRVLNCSGSGTVSDVIAGVDWVTAQSIFPAVANMSLGGSRSTALDTAVSNSISSGITYAIAAGNSSRDACNFSPARVPAAITVGATSQADERPVWSNYGKCLDLFAPGISIQSAWIGSDTATNTISGTSMATPHVTGIVALLLQGSPSSTPSEVSAELINKSTKNIVKSLGKNSPNRMIFTDY
ncbi:MAG: S8 family peptidase [Nitrosomonas sp.]|nr:S8 family peptidase [Nitrosomonas sp.]